MSDICDECGLLGDPATLISCGVVGTVCDDCRPEHEAECWWCRARNDDDYAIDQAVEA